MKVRAFVLNRLGPVGRALRGLRARLRQLDVSFARQEEALVRADEAIARIEAVDRRVRATHALVARLYELGQEWDVQLEAMRRAPDYELSYHPEPLMSVVIPTYNRAEMLCERSLASLRRQTYPHWEAVVVGDGCTDDTGERIAALGDPRIRWDNLSIRGPYPDEADSDFLLVAGIHASRRALSLATGQWIANLDDDDEWDDDHLEVLLAEAMKTKAEVVYGRWRQRDARNGRLINWEFGTWPVTFEQFAFQASIHHQALRHLAPDLNTRFLGEAGDWNRVRRMVEAGVRFAYVDRPVSTIWFMPRKTESVQRLDWLTDKVGYVDE